MKQLLQEVTAARTVSAEQRRLDADAQVARDAHAAQLALDVQAAALDMKRQQQLAAEQARGERDTVRAARKAAAKARRVQSRRVAWAAVARAGESALWVGPILAPMAVAWVGQIQFAMQVLQWSVAGAIVFAAAFELTTVYVARLDFLARQAGDSGLVFRAATWVFALLAAAMNYGHAAGPGWSPTGAAVAYGAMSLTGIALWELLSLYRHRVHLRDTGQRPAPLPRFGIARWLNFPAVTWMARRLAIRDGHRTADAAWQASTGYWAQRRETRQGRTRIAATAGAARTEPATVPAKRRTRADRETVTVPATGELVAQLRGRSPELTTAQIAARLGLSERTVRRYMA